MNQPYDPRNRYGDQSGWYHDPQAPGAYRQHDGLPAQPPAYSPPPSKLPMLVAAALVLVLAVGVTLFLVLRDERTVAAGGGGQPDTPSAIEVTQQFFQAVDDVDEKGMTEIARGDINDDIQDIVEQGGTDEVTFADGTLVDDGSKTVDDVKVAVVLWGLADVPGEYGGDLELSVGLLDDGDGYRVCSIDDDPGAGSIDELVVAWADEFEDYCDYEA